MFILYLIFTIYSIISLWYNNFMNANSLKKLEFNKITNILADFAMSESAKNLCYNLSPENNLEKVSLLLDETDCATSYLCHNVIMDFSTLKDITKTVNAIKVESILLADDIIDIKNLLSATHSVILAEDKKDFTPSLDIISSNISKLDSLKVLYSSITKVFDDDNEIKDDATPTLFEIREKIKKQEVAIHSVLDEKLELYSDYLQEKVITLRQGRYCIPVRSEHKPHVKGIVHSISSTGSTLFIEPIEVAEKNNELSNLFAQEKNEINKILKNLTAICFENKDTLINNFNILNRLDFIFAKGKYANSINATRPLYSNKLDIKSGRHPLIDPSVVVPINVSLDENIKQLIITGPNTGGKTVSLKLIGLFSLMAQSGLNIPASENSSLLLFNDVFVDIGDEQSIEQSLSTFSSHIKNIISFVDKANENSLILLDELCQGTEPSQGEALAISILEHFKNKGCYVIATTHYNQLKIYAQNTSGVINASCEFDESTLMPTYKLIIGIPGKSNAFEISSRLGLKNEIIKNAKSFLGENEQSMDRVLKELSDNEIKYNKAKEEISKQKEEITSLKKAYQKQLDSIENQKNKIIEKAKSDALDILNDAKIKADDVIKNIRKSNIDSDKLIASRTKVKSSIKNLHTSNANSNSDFVPIDPSKINIGDMVHIVDLNLDGTINTLPDSSGNLIVKTGIIKTKTNVKKLALPKESESNNNKKFRKTSTFSGSLQDAPQLELNLLGLDSFDAIMEVDRFLDQAMSSKLAEVRIVHGKGSGILRKAVREHLKKSKYVKEYKEAEYGQGDSGVTIVTLN